MTVLAVLFVVAVLIFVIEMLRREKIREKYAVLWIVIGLATLILAVFPDLLIWAAHVVGVQIPSNLLFAIALILLMGVTLHLSREVSASEDEIRALAEEVAILRADLRDIQDQLPKDPESRPIR
ncbi:DUF2304 domain-containing protein [Sinomonas humi]|uniref:DUF2304 domain-containing protein n=1 Tax=Sinomonas humi TaxID=1338436 RepID=A0A0B2AFF5_9MICC|nr:DUF2304 domain-containing protein [Sinomonas humi]KHL00637.1 hypothetical protein LK10_19040 [Sinomonas humi]